MAEPVEWWTLPDRTLVRDHAGELRMVRRYHREGPLGCEPGEDPYDDVWLDHWSDEYAPVWRTGGRHAERENAALTDEERQLVTVVEVTG